MDGNDAVVLGKNDKHAKLDLIDCGCAGAVPAGEPLCAAQLPLHCNMSKNSECHSGFSPWMATTW